MGWSTKRDCSSDFEDDVPEGLLALNSQHGGCMRWKLCQRRNKLANAGHMITVHRLDHIARLELRVHVVIIVALAQYENA
jgi:hypothetical protein